VIIWFCGLDSPERHLDRVRARASQGGHDIPEANIRARYPEAQRNLIALMPFVAHLRVYDNSAEASTGDPVLDPVLVMELEQGCLVQPSANDRTALERTPQWAKALVEAALSLD
jgi:predicted ABC-type ATPase